MARIMLWSGLLLALVAPGWSAPIHAAAGRGDVAAIQRLLDGDPALLTQGDEQYGGTALHWAASAGKTAVVTLLLDRGADVHAVNKSGQTPLMVAAGAGKAEVVALLAGKTDLARQDKDGNTALHWAALYGDPDTVARLLDAKADVVVKNAAGYTARSLAVERGHTKAYELLRAASPAPPRKTTTTADATNPAGLTVRITRAPVVAAPGTTQVTITIEHPAREGAAPLVFLPAAALQQCVAAFGVTTTPVGGRAFDAQGSWVTADTPLVNITAPLPTPTRLINATLIGGKFALGYLGGMTRDLRYTLALPKTPAAGQLAFDPDDAAQGAKVTADKPIATYVLGPLLFNSSDPAEGATAEGVLLLPGQRYAMTFVATAIGAEYYLGCQVTYRFVPAVVTQRVPPAPGSRRYAEALAQVPPATLRSEAFYIGTAHGEDSSLTGDALVQMRARIADGYATAPAPTRAAMMLVVRDRLGRPLPDATVKAYDEKAATVTVPDTVPDKDKFYTPEIIEKYFKQLDTAPSDVFGAFWSEKLPPGKTYKWVITRSGFQPHVIYGPVKAPDLSYWLTGLQRFDVYLTMAPIPPVTVTGVAGNQQITLNWTPPADLSIVAGYNVYRSTSTNGQYAPVNAQLVPANARTFADTTMGNGANYYMVSVIGMDGSVLSTSTAVAVQYKGAGDAGVGLLPFSLQLNLPATSTVSNDQLAYIVPNYIGKSLSAEARTVYPIAIQQSINPQLLTLAQNGNTGALSQIAKAHNVRYLLRGVGTNRGLVITLWDSQAVKDLAAVRRNLVSVSENSPLWDDIAQEVLRTVGGGR